MSGTIDWHTRLFGLWLVVPACTLGTLVAVAVRRRLGLMTILASISVAVAFFTIVALWLSWSTFYYVSVDRAELQADGEWRSNVLYLSSIRGGLRLSYEIGSFHPPTPPDQALRVSLCRGRIGEGNWYPAYDQSMAGKSDIAATGLGFQIVVINHPINVVRLGLDSITLPHWFVLLLCVPFPLIWFRRFRRHRHRVRHGLCLKCGYDLRGSDDTCSECGAPIPKSPRPRPKPALEQKSPTSAAQQ